MYGIVTTTSSSNVKSIILVDQGWGLPDPIYRNFFTANLVPDAPRDVAESLDELQRISTSADIAGRIWDMNNFNDVEALASQVRSPTLVMHATGDRMVPIDEGRKIAKTIPGARFLELPGENHMLLEHENAFGIFIEETIKFIAEHSC